MKNIINYLTVSSLLLSTLPGMVFAVTGEAPREHSIVETTEEDQSEGEDRLSTEELLIEETEIDAIEELSDEPKQPEDLVAISEEEPPKEEPNIKEELAARDSQAIKTLFPDPSLAQAVADIFERTVDDQISIENELNPYSKSLEFTEKQIIKLDGMEHFVSVSRINLGSNNISDVNPLSGLVNLTWLSLQINKLKDISALSELVNLNSLHIDKNQISDVSGLGKLSKLVTLNAFSNQITDISSVSGANTKIDARFQSINLAEVDEEMTSSISLATLSSLSMEIDWVTEGTLIENQLKWIHLGENKLDFNGGGISSSGAQVYFSGTVTQEVIRTRYIKELFPDPNLAKAVAEIFMRTIDDPISIKNELNPYSEVIDFSNKQIIKLDGMEYFEKTTRINFNGNSIVDISKLAHLKLITYCTLDNNKISDIAPLVSNSSSLTHLSVAGNEITELPNDMAIPRLSTFYLNSNKIENLKPLEKLTNIQTLGLAFNLIVDISPLSKLTLLKTVWLTSNKIESVSSLSGLTNITELYLSNNMIEDISSFNKLIHLAILQLRNNKIKNISSLSELGWLIQLRLGANKISDISSLTKLSADPRLKILEIENQTLELEQGVAGNESLFKLSTLDGLPIKLVFQDEGTLIDDRLVWVNSGHNRMTFDGSGETGNMLKVNFSGVVTQEVIMALALTAVPKTFDFGTGNSVSPMSASIQGESMESITVEDIRDNQLGWRLQVRMTELISSTDNRLTGATMSTKTEFNETGDGDSPHLFETVIINSANSQLVTANPGEGIGKWSVGFNELTLNVPGATAKSGEAYAGNVIWTLLDTP